MCDTPKITDKEIEHFMKHRKSETDDSQQCRQIIGQLRAELAAARAILANVKGVANFYNSDTHANHKYEGRVFSQDIERMLKDSK